MVIETAKEKKEKTIKKKKKRKRKKWTINIDEVMKIIIPEVTTRLGLDYLELTEKELRDVIEPIVSSIIEARKTKPTTESLIKRIINGKPMLFKALSAKMLEREKLAPQQIEFILANAPELAGRAAPRLYHEILEAGLEYLLDTLRYLWQRYGKPTRIQCPYCGFYAVTPGLSCIVCGRVIEERDLKKAIGFNKQLAMLAEVLDKSLLEEIIKAGFVVYDGDIHPPSLRQRLPHGVVLYLTREERDLLRRILNREEA